MEILPEPWTSFVIEFPTYPKQLINGKEESQRILFLCPRAESNPTELCLALFGSQILMHRLQQVESTSALSTISFIFVYSAETPDALRTVLAKYQTITNAPVMVAHKSNVVKSAHFVTEFLNRESLTGLGSQSVLNRGIIGDGAGPAAGQIFTPIDTDETLWTEALPEIVLVEEDGTTVHASHDLKDYRAEYACRFVLEHFSENINRDKMAERVNLSPGYFSNLFRSEVGMSFSDYLIQVRIDNAKCLLRRFDLSVDAISKKCGFNSLAHFSRTFKDRCKRSPLKYRKSPNAVN
ncbi:MAG: AraC family transcriptional regulator [Gemmatimonadales bacterium]|nr:AraC family transcriptional regulator [Gemmatimonadales bacterium]